ncbi:hypothetical protein [Deinococcus sonorensis]|uniref:PBS lyase n=1 Tax=Deinococcus sonorensis TaxID=309891 RepID=A0ABV8Y7X7_9DEIO
MPRPLPTRQQLKAVLDTWRHTKMWRRSQRDEPLQALLATLEPADLLRLDERLRTVLWSHPLRDFATPAWLRSIGNDRTPQPAILTLLASHPDGTLREAVVRRLAKVRTPLATAALLVRLNDWAEPVRQAAELAMLDRLDAADLPHLLPNLALILRFAGAVRAPNEHLVRRVLALLATDPGLAALQDVLPTVDAPTRLLLAREVLKSGQTLPDALTQLLLQDRSAPIRRAIAAVVEEEQLLPLLDDPDARVRALALTRWLEASPPTRHAERLASALVDRQATVRMVALGALRHQGLSARDAYLNLDPAQLPERQLPGWIAGLASQGTATDAPLIVPFARHPRTRVRLEALRALGRLDASTSLPQLVEGVLDGNAVSHVAIRALTRSNLLTPDLLRSLWARVDSPRLQGRLLSLALGLSRFEAAGLLLAWQPEAAPELVDRMDRAVASLMDGYHRVYYTPPPTLLMLAVRLRAARLPTDHPLVTVQAQLPSVP